MNQKTSQRGSALIYILIAIALLGALTATFMDSSSQQTSSQNTFNYVTEIQSQANFIRSAIQECVLTYPAGDAALIGGLNAPYPLNPSDPYLLNPAGSLVENIRCPGNPGDSNNHAKIFGGSSGKFLPPPPKLFDKWYYQSNIDGVWIELPTNKTDAFLKNALTKLDDLFAECEADVVDATGAQRQMVSDWSDVCQQGYYCFRVRLTAKPTAVYAGDTDGDESSCP